MQLTEEIIRAELADVDMRLKDLHARADYHRRELDAVEGLLQEATGERKTLAGILAHLQAAEPENAPQAPPADAGV